MKRIILYITGIVIILTASFYAINNKIEKNKRDKEHKEWLENAEHTISHNVQILTNAIRIDYLDEQRTLAIYLPEHYDNDSSAYSVIYFLDGESLYDQKIQEGMEWEIDEVLDSLGRIGGSQSIVVGIYSSENRMKEYKPFPSDRWYSDKVVSGDKHAAWIVSTLKPWIDARYRTKQEAKYTVIAGASLGGLMSYYMLMEYPEVFGGALVLSPSFWVNENVYTLHEKNDKLKDQKIYFDAGELETPTVKSIEKMKETLLRAGMPERNIGLDVEEGLGHWHMTWKAGFKKSYPWIVMDE